MAVEAVVFDWGGTLAEYGDLDMADMWHAAARHLAPDRAEEVCAQLVAVEEASWARVGLDQRSTTLSALLALASAQLGLDVAQAVLEEAATHHLDSWTPHMRHDPQAPATLAALKEMGLGVGLLSNTHWPRAFHEHFLDRDGLTPFIDVRCYTSELTYTKPHPEAFGAVLSQLGVDEATRAVFVGDRPYDDVFGAKSCGMRAVLRPNPAVPPYPVEPDAVIATLPELIDLVETWR
ncbi:MAG: HAD family hydrolase [Actinomycetota bacterium]|nr:HAD family hydrolase [Actinomycetota bacterium]PLS75390.1 MAG: HAD family hydrolase [Actinomycetota bacterium]